MKKMDSSKGKTLEKMSVWWEELKVQTQLCKSFDGFWLCNRRMRIQDPRENWMASKTGQAVPPQNSSLAKVEGLDENFPVLFQSAISQHQG